MSASWRLAGHRSLHSRVTRYFGKTCWDFQALAFVNPDTLESLHVSQTFPLCRTFALLPCCPRRVYFDGRLLNSKH